MGLDCSTRPFHAVRPIAHVLVRSRLQRRQRPRHITHRLNNNRRTQDLYPWHSGSKFRQF